MSDTTMTATDGDNDTIRVPTGFPALDEMNLMPEYDLTTGRGGRVVVHTDTYKTGLTSLGLLFAVYAAKAMRSDVLWIGADSPINTMEYLDMGMWGYHLPEDTVTDHEGWDVPIIHYGSGDFDTPVLKTLDRAYPRAINRLANPRVIVLETTHKQFSMEDACALLSCRSEYTKARLIVLYRGKLLPTALMEDTDIQFKLERGEGTTSQLYAACNRNGSSGREMTGHTLTFTNNGPFLTRNPQKDA